MQAHILILFFSLREEPMIPDDHDEVDLNDYDPEEERARRAQYDDDDDDRHQQGVSCATQ